MSLAAKLDLFFDGGARSRGEKLFASRAVRWIESSGHHAVAQVMGGSPYQVRLTLEDDALWTWCDCPYFYDQGPCKHLWAAVLEADSRGALADADAVKHLEIEEEFGPDEDGHDFGLHLPARIAPPAARVPAWREYLGAVQRELQANPPAAAEAKQPAEILYVIDVPGCRASGQIAL